MAKKIKLGRGLDALLLSGREERVQGGDKLEQIPLNQLQRGKFQPRNDIDPESLTELVESIRYQGVIQPIIVRKIDGKYEVIAGERRWRASILAEITDIPAIIRQMSDEVALAIGLIENIQREALTPLEEAKALARLIEDFKITHAKVSSMVGRSRSSVSNLIRLLQLNDSVKKFLDNGDIEMGHARSLLSLEHNVQLEIATIVINKQLTVRQAETLVKNTLNPPPLKEQTAEHILLMAGDLTNKIGNKVQIKFIGNKGKITINFSSEAELSKIISKI